MKVSQKRIVVTGAGSGIGRDLVLQLLDKGASVAASDINEASLTETKNLAGNRATQLVTHILDISDKEKVESYATEIIRGFGPIDGVINNAGIIQPFVDVNDLDYDRIHRIMNTDFWGTLYMTKAFLPHLLKRPEAHITNISSMGGFIPFPGQTIYSAAKAAVKIFTEGLFAELKDTKVGVTVVMPGAVNTNIMKNSGADIKTSGAEGKSYNILPSEKAAAMIIDAIEKNRFRLLAGRDAWFLDLFYRFSPERAVRFIVKQMGALKNPKSK